MKKIKIYIACLLVMSMYISCTSKKTSSQREWLKDQHDQTDVFAIPLDSSEEEEEAEEKALQIVS